MAENLRAAMCRRDAAIRDYFDVHHAVRRGGVRLDDIELLDLVRRKVAMPGNDAPDTSAERLRALRPELQAELAPVVRAVDLAAFDIDRVFAMVSNVAESLNRRATPSDS